MKLRLLLASALLATSAYAVESEMKVIGRFDYNSLETKAAGEKETSGELTTQFLRWKNTAKFSDTVTGELTLDFKAVGSQTTEDGETTTNFLDLVDTAFITKTFGPGLSLTIGKQATLTGGRENDWSQSDLYTTSAFFEALPANTVGLTLGYTFADQTFYAQYLEGETTELTDKKITGVAWYGNIANLVNPIVSYHKEGTDRPGQYDTLLSAGLQFNVSSFLVEFDYNTRTNENGSGTNPAVDAELTSMVAHVRYNHENWRPFAKYIMDDAEGSFELGSGGVEQERTAWELGLEYVQNKDEALRYHLVYGNSETKNSSGAENKIENTSIVAGVKFALSL